MKVNLVKDANGKVVASFEHPVARGTSIRPVLKPGHTVHEVNAPEDYKKDIKALYKQHSR
jgi:hypothetical protein